MSALLWWLIPLGATLLALGWAAMRSRPPRVADTHVTLDEMSKFRAAMGRPMPSSDEVEAAPRSRPVPRAPGPSSPRRPAPTSWPTSESPRPAPKPQPKPQPKPKPKSATEVRRERERAAAARRAARSGDGNRPRERRQDPHGRGRGSRTA